MTLLELKWISASLILVLSLSAGFASFQFAKRYQHRLQLGDSFANGIFIGVAIFHLIPHAIGDLFNLQLQSAYLSVFGIVLTTLIILYLMDRIIYYYNPRKRLLLGAWLIIFTLTIHSLIAGITLGLSDTVAMVTVMIIAIGSHKIFEMFALVINLQKRLASTQYAVVIFILFAFVTPLGIWAGIYFETVVQPYVDHLLSASFSAIAAGTFLYIGLMHHHHLDTSNKDSHQQYSNVVSTILGFGLMGFISLWV